MSRVSSFSLLSAPKKPYQHLYFKFQNSGRNIRLSVATQIKRYFRETAKQRYGGWISRLHPTEDANAMFGYYHVHIFSRSDDMRTDPKFSGLWVFLSDVLEVDPNDVSTGPMTEEWDPGFEYKFILDFQRQKKGKGGGGEKFISIIIWAISLSFR